MPICPCILAGTSSQPPWRVPAPSSRCHRKDKNGRTPSHSPKLSTAWFGSKANFLESGGIGVRFYTIRPRKARATSSIVCDIFLRSLASCTWVARSVLGLPGSTGAASASNLSRMSLLILVSRSFPDVCYFFLCLHVVGVDVRTQS